MKLEVNCSDLVSVDSRGVSHGDDGTGGVHVAVGAHHLQPVPAPITAQYCILCYRIDQSQLSIVLLYRPITAHLDSCWEM